MVSPALTVTFILFASEGNTVKRRCERTAWLYQVSNSVACEIWPCLVTTGPQFDIWSFLEYQLCLETDRGALQIDIQ